MTKSEKKEILYWLMHHALKSIMGDAPITRAQWVKQLAESYRND